MMAVTRHLQMAAPRWEPIIRHISLGWSRRHHHQICNSFFNQPSSEHSHSLDPWTLTR